MLNLLAVPKSVFFLFNFDFVRAVGTRLLQNYTSCLSALQSLQCRVETTFAAVT